MFARLVLLGLLVCASVFAADVPVDKRYPGPWREDFHRGITQTLVTNQISGCGQYKYRESALDPSEYVVYCTSDGKFWTAYLIWPKIGKLMGPYAPDASLK
jgi:hypothetical protein